MSSKRSHEQHLNLSNPSPRKRSRFSDTPPPAPLLKPTLAIIPAKPWTKSQQKRLGMTNFGSPTGGATKMGSGYGYANRVPVGGFIDFLEEGQRGVEEGKREGERKGVVEGRGERERRDSVPTRSDSKNDEIGASDPPATASQASLPAQEELQAIRLSDVFPNRGIEAFAPRAGNLKADEQDILTDTSNVSHISGAHKQEQHLSLPTSLPWKDPMGSQDEHVEVDFREFLVDDWSEIPHEIFRPQHEVRFDFLDSLFGGDPSV